MDSRKYEFSYYKDTHSTRHHGARICDTIFLYNLNITHQIYDKQINYVSAVVILKESEVEKTLIRLSKLEGSSCASANLARYVTASWKSMQSY